MNHKLKEPFLKIGCERIAQIRVDFFLKANTVPTSDSLVIGFFFLMECCRWYNRKVTNTL